MAQPTLKPWLWLSLASLALLPSCSSVRYLWQAAEGQMQLLTEAKPIDQVIADPATTPEVRRKLQLVQQVRAFGVQEMGFPDHGSYQKYVDLGRPYVVWNVFSAPEFSTTLRTQCFPVAGCVGYQGFFAEADARAEAERRRALGDDVQVAGITAYSTLGYLRDPVLSNMFGHDDVWLIRTILHEMAHPTLYVPDDTDFNESYATALENEATRRWMKRQGTPELASDHATDRARTEQWVKLTLEAREQLNQLYAQPLPDAEKRARKAAIFDDLQAKATALRREWFGPEAAPAARQSNASLGSAAAYADLVPTFEALLSRLGGNIPAFIRAASECAKQPKPQRPGCLDAAGR